MSDYECDRCGVDCRANKTAGYIQPWELLEIKEAYKTIFVSKLCLSCSSKANSFLNYYGEKKKADLRALADYLRSGERSGLAEINAYSAMQNAGYYEQIRP